MKQFNTTGTALIADMTSEAKNTIRQVADLISWGTITANNSTMALGYAQRMLDVVEALAEGKLSEDEAKDMFTKKQSQAEFYSKRQ